MTIETIYYRFRVRGGTAAALTALNEVPLERELVFETDTGRAKLGDGVTPYNALDYTAGGAPVELRSSGTHIQWRPVGGPDWFDLVAYEDISEPGPAGPPGPPGPSSSCFPTASFDGGLGDIAVGAHCDLFVPFAFAIDRATLVGDAAGTLQVDIRVVPFAAHPPGPTHTICGGAAPTLASVNRSQDATLTGWTRSVAAASVIRFIVTASAGVKRATLVLDGSRS